MEIGMLKKKTAMIQEQHDESVIEGVSVSIILERTRLLWTFPSSQSHLISKNYAKGFRT